MENRGVWYVLKSLNTEDDANSVPSLPAIFWFVAGILALLGIVVFFVLAIILATASILGRANVDLTVLRQFAEGYAIIFTGYGAFMGGCGAALALKTKSGA